MICGMNFKYERREFILFSLDRSVTENKFFLVSIRKEKKTSLPLCFFSIWNDNKKLRLVFGFKSQADPMNRIFNLLTYLISSMIKLLYEYMYLLLNSNGPPKDPRRSIFSFKLKLRKHLFKKKLKSWICILAGEPA